MHGAVAVADAGGVAGLGNEFEFGLDVILGAQPIDFRRRSLKSRLS